MWFIIKNSSIVQFFVSGIIISSKIPATISVIIFIVDFYGFNVFIFMGSEIRLFSAKLWTRLKVWNLFPHLQKSQKQKTKRKRRAIWKMHSLKAILYKEIY